MNARYSSMKSRFALLIALMACYFCFGRSGFTQSPELPRTSPKENVKDKPDKAEEKPYDLKGDTLGMSLKDFKAKHKRQIADGSRYIQVPRCTNESSDEKRQTDPDLMSGEEYWHVKANIVNAKLSVLFEDGMDSKFTPTLAGEKAAMHYYSFIDDKLYLIAFIMPRTGYKSVKDAMVETYGKPTSEMLVAPEDGMGNRFRSKLTEWKNSTSAISMSDRIGDNQYFAISFTHTKLNEIAAKRKAIYNKPKL